MVAAKVLLGDKSFGAGVCYGIVKNPVEGVIGAAALIKTFVFADLYDSIYRRRWWENLFSVSPLGSSAMAAQVAARAALAAGLLSEAKLKEAFEERTALITELGHVLKDPVEFITSLPAKVADQYKAKWAEFQSNYARPDLKSQFRAGEILGDVLMDLFGLATGVAGLAKLASKAPRLVRLFQRGGKASKAIAAGSDGMAGGGAGPAGPLRASRGPEASRPPPAPKEPPRLATSGARLPAKQDGALHNREWLDVKTDWETFKAERPEGLDMANLSPADKMAAETLKNQGRNPLSIKQVLDSGRDFKLREFQKDQKLYGFDSTGGPGKSPYSPYWLDEKSFREMELKHKKDGAWDRQGVKNELALPCANRADGIVEAKVLEDHVGVESTVGPATENVTYRAADGTVIERSLSLPGGGTQLSPGLGKVGPIP
jgi:hypothetical protein